MGPMRFERMTSAVARRETELRATIKELEIQINASALQHILGCVAHLNLCAVHGAQYRNQEDALGCPEIPRIDANQKHEWVDGRLWQVERINASGTDETTDPGLDHHQDAGPNNQPGHHRLEHAGR